MPKVKVKRKDTFIDMTAMSDVTVLLLTFFMLTSTFIKKEPVQVSTPQSVSETKIPETNIMQILIDHEGRIFMSLDKQSDKIEVLKRVGEKYGVEFTDKELRDFSLMETFGASLIKNEDASPEAVQRTIALLNQDRVTSNTPIGMKLFLALPMEFQDKALKSLGIPNPPNPNPTDNVTKYRNQFQVWVETTRNLMNETEREGGKFRIAIKAGSGTPYPIIKNVMNDLRDLHENRYNLITSLKGGGESSAAGAH